MLSPFLGRVGSLQARRGRLLPGIYERISTGFGTAVRSIFIFTRKASYKPRYNIFGLAQRAWDKLMPFHFNRELQKALDIFIKGGLRAVCGGSVFTKDE